MGKVRKQKNINLVPAYALLAVGFLLFAMFIADRQMRVAHKYTDQVETFNEYKVWDKQGNQYELTIEDSKRIRRLDFFAYIFPHMAYICSRTLHFLTICELH